MSENEIMIAEKVCKLYEECKKTMGVQNILLEADVLFALPNEDIERFYVTMTDFFLQEGQRKLLGLE